MRLEQVIRGGKYRHEAFELVWAALVTAISKTYALRREDAKTRGPELCWAVRDLALLRYGDDAPDVLESWGITASEDIGTIFGGLVAAGLASKTGEDDLLKGFANIWRVRDAFANALSPWRGVCGTCGYDLRGTPGGACPECGAPRNLLSDTKGEDQ